MLRIPNPVSDPEVFVRVFVQLHSSLSGTTDFGLDDISSAMISRGNVTSQGAMGAEALRRSTRADRSRDPLYNQSKMYAELFRSLGWLHSTTSSLRFRFTSLGARVTQEATQRSLVRECLLGMSFPSEAIAVQSSQSIRPFACILRTMNALRTLTRDEMMAGPLSIDDDSDSDAFESMVARLRDCRKHADRLDKWLAAIAKRRGISRRPTMENYTRFPIGVLGRSGWCVKSRGQLVITESDKLAAESIASTADWRLSDFEELPPDVKAPFLRWTYHLMLDRAGLDVSNRREQMSLDSQELAAATPRSVRNAYFSPFQQLSFETLSRYVPELLAEAPVARTPTSPSIAPLVSSTARRVAEYHDLTPQLTQRTGPAPASVFAAELTQLTATLGGSDAAASRIHVEVGSYNRDQFYPLVGDVLRLLGLDCQVSRGGQNYNRADAMIVDRAQSLPIEIKSPGEETEVSVKAIRQALENKIPPGRFGGAGPGGRGGGALRRILGAAPGALGHGGRSAADPGSGGSRHRRGGRGEDPAARRRRGRQPGNACMVAGGGEGHHVGAPLGAPLMAVAYAPTATCSGNVGRIRDVLIGRSGRHSYPRRAAVRLRPGRMPYPTRAARNPRVTPPITYVPTTSPRAFTPNARVAAAPGKSIVVGPASFQMKPWKPAPSRKTPTMSPRGFTSQAAVMVAPGTSNGVKTPLSMM